MRECVSALVGLRDVWWREVNCGIEKGRRGTAEGFPMDSRRIPEGFPRVVGQLDENQEVAVVYRRLMQCIDSQVLRCCGKEGIKNVGMR